jgi:cytochrome P450
MVASPTALFTNATLADPYAVYRRLRTEDPVHWAAREGTWFLTRYDDVLAAFHDTRLSARRVVGAAPNGQIVDPLSHLLSLMMLFSDPPAHSRLRGLFNKAFTPRAVESLRPMVQATIDRLLDAAEQRGELEVVGEYAYPLPALVMAQMMGIPAEDRPAFDRWVHDLATFIGSPRLAPEQRRRTAQSMQESLHYFERLMVRRRADPGDDLLSALAEGEGTSDAVSGQELLANVILTMTAGHETTQNLIGNGLLALLRHPDQLERLRSERELLVPATEELLRYDSPAQWTGRIAATDLQIRNRTIRRGQFVIAAQGAANRDPEVFSNPDHLDLGRAENRHLAFGHGPHFCIGAGLSRLEGQIALGTLVRRFPKLRLADESPPWRANFVLRGLERLPVRL